MTKKKAKCPHWAVVIKGQSVKCVLCGKRMKFDKWEEHREKFRTIMTKE